MMSKPVPKFRVLLSLAALSAGALSFAPVQAQLLGGNASGGLGGTLSPRQLDVGGQLRANAQLPRGEALRDAAGKTAAQARGTAGAAADTAVQAQGTATTKALQAQAMATGTAQAAGAIAADKAVSVQDTAGRAAGMASAGGDVTVKPEGRGVSASASGQANVSR